MSLVRVSFIISGLILPCELERSKKPLTLRDLITLVIQRQNRLTVELKQFLMALSPLPLSFSEIATHCGPYSTQ